MLHAEPSIMANQRQERIGIVFQENPAVIVSVLKNLSAREIGKFSPVCRSWNRYGRKILEGRKWMCSHLIEDEDADTVPAEVMEYLDKLPIIPRVVLFFERGPRKFLENMMLEWRRRLHPDCRLLAIDCSYLRCFSTSPSMNTFVFPTLPEGAHLISSNLSSERCRQLAQVHQLSRADINSRFAIPDQLTVWCVLIFSSDGGLGVQSLCNAFWNRDSGQIALCGGIGTSNGSIEPSSGVFSRRCSFLLAFCGPNVSASSVVIGESEDPAAKLRLLKEHISSLKVAPKQMFAFQLVGLDVPKEKFHLQCEQFHQMFGQTPLTNIGTYWGYGHDYSPTRPMPPLPLVWCLPRASSIFALVAIM